MIRHTSIVAMVAVGLALGAPILAQDPGKPQDPGKVQDPSKASQSKDPGQLSKDEVMQAITKAAALAPQHAQLKPLAGKWNIEGKCRMTPEAPWEPNKSTCTAEMILGGRFLEERYKGDAMPGMPGPFEGVGLIGYDDQKKKFISVWADNMGTMVLTSEGTADDSGKTITLRSQDYTCPITGKQVYLKSVYQIESNDKFILKMYGPGPDGKEFQNMELVHTRTST